MAETTSKERHTRPQYELLYHPSIPGRGEFIRLAFEAAGVPYTDLGNEPDGYKIVQEICMTGAMRSESSNPPVFAPPALRVSGAGRGKEALVIYQTPAILQYLGEKLGLIPDDEVGRIYTYQLALTALDLNNEIHDTHHPIAIGKYYEEQKDAALEKASDVRENRIPKYLSHFERTLKWNRDAGKGQYMIGDKVTYADLVVWQVLDGLLFAFPVEMQARKQEFPDLLNGFYTKIKEERGIKAYLASERRLPYSQGVFRHYPELDRQQ
jgi:glutathione S-transferase